jgi:hypothetical protein
LGLLGDYNDSSSMLMGKKRLEKKKDKENLPRSGQRTYRGKRIQRVRSDPFIGKSDNYNKVPLQSFGGEENFSFGDL